MSLVGKEFVDEVPHYDELVVNDLDSKYRTLYETSERLVLRLEAENERLREELAELKSGSSRPVFDPVLNPTNSTTLPQGIQLPSAFRTNLEERLRQKAFGLEQVKKEEEKSNEV